MSLVWIQRRRCRRRWRRGGDVSGVRQEGRQALQIPLSLINLSSSLSDAPPSDL